MAVKKAKRKLQHREAIAEFQRWKKKHPKATHQEIFNAFDRYVDSIDLAEAIQKDIEKYASTPGH